MTAALPVLRHFKPPQGTGLGYRLVGANHNFDGLLRELAPSPFQICRPLIFSVNSRAFSIVKSKTIGEFWFWSLFFTQLWPFRTVPWSVRKLRRTARTGDMVAAKDQSPWTLLGCKKCGSCSYGLNDERNWLDFYCLKTKLLVDFSIKTKEAMEI